MTALRTPLETALGHQLDLDFSDLDLGDYEAQDAADFEAEQRHRAAAGLGINDRPVRLIG